MFRVFELVVFIAQKGVFSFQNIVKDIFLAYITLQKKVGKMAIFRPKRWVNPSGKMSNFGLFKLLFFLALYAIKKSQNNGRFLIKTMGLEKSQFYFFLNFLFLQPRKVFFRSRISSKAFSCSILGEKKTWKNHQFWTKTMGSPLWKNVHFSTFFNFLFLQPRKAIFRSRIS